MTFILTLVASDRPLSAGHLALTERFTENEGLALAGDPEWLNPHKAVDIPLPECLTLEQTDRLRAALAEDRIDVFCTAAQSRRKKLLCADMESTIIDNEMLEELAEDLGLKDDIAAITARAMNGEIDFIESLTLRVGMLKDLPEDTLTDALPALKVNPGAQTLVRTMRAHGAECVLITGGFTVFSNHIAEKLGFHHHHANILEILDGRLSGKLQGDILDPDSKLNFLNHHCKRLGIDPDDAIAMGDGANDLPMLTRAGLGVAYRPKPVLQETMQNQIRHADFTAALYTQGYKAQDFATE